MRAQCLDTAQLLDAARPLWQNGIRNKNAQKRKDLDMIECTKSVHYRLGTAIAKVSHTCTVETPLPPHYAFSYARYLSANTMLATTKNSY
jgi:hypothetical protein